MHVVPRALCVAWAALALAASCAAPAHLAHRSPLLEPAAGPLTPEGRARPLPSMESSGASEDARGEAIAQTAREYLGARGLKDRRFPDDCTGLVRAVYARHGIDLFSDGGEPGDSGVMAIWHYAQKHGFLHREKPRAGDIVFFSETYDRNRDGRENDGLTHVGIVDRVEPDGTVLVIHRVARGIVTYRMNVERARERQDSSGHVLNDWLREGKKSKLAGELFAGYGTLARN